MTLRQLRKSRGVKQSEIKTVSQSFISRLENGRDVRLSKLKAYIEGIGGKLEIYAVFPDGVRFPITVK